MATLLASDATVLQQCLEVRSGQLAPNIFLAAIHYLLLCGLKHDLAAYYPTMTPTPMDLDDRLPDILRDFIEKCHSDLQQNVSTRLVQTNEVLRCSTFLPVLMRLSGRSPGSLLFVDVGCSLGLHLGWDRYSYAYDDGTFIGSNTSTVVLSSSLRGDLRASSLRGMAMPSVSRRVGLELEKPDRDWLRALIWPEHKDRLDRFDAAVRLLDPRALPIVYADAAATLPTILEDSSEDIAILLFAYSANQIYKGGRPELTEVLRGCGRSRPIIEISMGHFSGGVDPDLVACSYYGTDAKTLWIGTCQVHGEWSAWRHT